MIEKVSLNSQSQEIKERRSQLQQDIEEFEKQGGKIKEIPFGVSANPYATVFKNPQDCSAIIDK